MDQKVVLAVAGSGKTSLIVERLNLNERILLVTYTTNNLLTLRRRVIEKFTYLPENIRLYSYFTFLYSFAYKPFLSHVKRSRGINWDIPLPRSARFAQQGHEGFYMDRTRRLYHNRIAKLLDQAPVVDDVIARLEKYVDRLYFDEVQDLAGHDFNFMSSLCRARVGTLWVGDFFQHTFETSRDGSVNSSLHKDYAKYQARLRAIGLVLDSQSLERSRRCSPTVCRFISERLGIHIASNRNDETAVKMIDDAALAREIFEDRGIVKLFLKEHYKYSCYSENWGVSKGQDHYNDVCVVLSDKNYEEVLKGGLVDLAPQTRNKLYVACSRARNDLFFVRQSHFKKLG